MKEGEYDRYVAFYRELGPILKEGLGRDHANRDKIAGTIPSGCSTNASSRCTGSSCWLPNLPATSCVACSASCALIVNRSKRVAMFRISLL